MNDHTHYEELAALAEGGHLSADEVTELWQHKQSCEQCKAAVAGFHELIHFGLPLAQGELRRSIHMITNRPDPGAAGRFLHKASQSGIVFSPDLHQPDRSRLNRRIVGEIAGVFAAVVIAYFCGSLRHDPGQRDEQSSMQAGQRPKPPSRQNSALANLPDANDRHARLTTPISEVNHSNGDNGQLQAEAAQSASQSTESQNDVQAQLKAQDKLLADTRAELARLNQAHSSDQATLVADQIHINELSEQLKTVKADATNAQHQLLTAGGDVRNLMGARQLHVVDVRDTDPNGKPGKAFGRVFLTEGKSLVFYAFDLGDTKKMNAKQTFEVWGQETGKPNSLRSLGFMNVDNQAQGRWALKANDPNALKGINTVFVTVEPQRGSKTPSGQRLLFAYLGEPNHP